MAINTPNIGLLKKEKTDGADTFNIPIMLNENWDKLDEAIGSLFSLTSDSIDGGTY